MSGAAPFGRNAYHCPAQTKVDSEAALNNLAHFFLKKQAS